MRIIRSPASFVRLLLLVSGVLAMASSSAFLALDRWDARASAAQLQEAPPTPKAHVKLDLGQGLAKLDAEKLYGGMVELARDLAPTATPTPAPTPTPPPAAPPASQPEAPAPVSQPQAPPPAQPGCPTAGISGYALDLFNSINSERAANGMPSLVANGCVTYVAQLRSNDMAANGYFSHTSPSGQTAFGLLDAYGIPFGWAGENLARNNYPDDQCVGVAIRDLMASPDHRSNILSPNYTEMGVAVAFDGAGMKYFTMVFIGPA